MTRVDFYLVSAAEGDGKHLAACRLTHKAYRLKHRIFILTQDADESAKLDRLLWTFSPGSFVPHYIAGTAASGEVPVLIGHDEPPNEFNDVLVSLAGRVAPFFARFARVAELVGAGDAERAAARERFRQYRDSGAVVQTYNL